jgi:WD40 repeat protein/DNA-binding SARP family transcriptional activator
LENPWNLLPDPAGEAYRLGMDFRLLGPIEVVDGGSLLPLGGPKPRTLVAHLVLELGQRVPAERLIDAVWGDEPPEAVRNSLQSYVSHLRKVLGPDRLEGRSGGYVLYGQPDEVDVVRFERMVDDARRATTNDPAAAATTYRQALTLWRGPALDDLAGQPSLRADIAWLEELRLAATEERIEVELALGRHAEVLPELEQLTLRHPVRERLWGHLMVAMYRAGRQAGALAAYRRVQGYLADQVGVDPSPSLQRIHEQVLRHDLTLQLAGIPLRGYRVLERLGDGAFGVTSRAYHPSMGREVAIKAIHPNLANDPTFVRRFEAQAQLVAALDHPHLVPLDDHWREPDGAYLVTRFLRGGSLRDRLVAGPLAPPAVVGMVEHIASVLAVAHAQGLVHGDLVPENLVFDEDGELHVTDLGTVQMLADGASTVAAVSDTHDERGGEDVTPRADVAQLARLARQMLGGAAADAEGAVEPGPAGATDAIAAALRCSVSATPEGGADPLAFAAALREALLDEPTGGPSVVPSRNPYKGLRSFRESDAEDFFGRDQLVARLVGRLAGDGGDDAVRFLAVVGPSGSGKSSLVRAGLLPALRAGAVPGSQDWFLVDLTPGDDPIAALRTALQRVAVRPLPAEVDDQLADDPTTLGRAATAVLPAEHADLVLVVDQFEEVFTLVGSAERRAGFLDGLVAAVTDHELGIRVIVTVGADHYDQLLRHHGMAELVRAGSEVVVPLSPVELERAIVGPAASVGVSVAPEVVAQVVADVVDQPGSLPLLQYALTELYDAREDAVLAVDAYRRLGGVPGALARRAEDELLALDDQGQQAARQLLLHLVALGDGVEDTRRRVRRSDLLALDDADRMSAIIDVFGRARLLAFDRDPATREATVEVAHEALLREWGRLRSWIEAARTELRTERRLAAAARDWADAGSDPSFLASGARLARFEALADAGSVALTPVERAFLAESVTERDRIAAEDVQRRERERELERRSWRRLRALVAVLAVATLVAATLSGVALRQTDRLGEQVRITTARELAAESVGNLAVDPERSILLALEAIDTTRGADGSVLPEAEHALHHAVVASRLVLSVPDAYGRVAWHPDGRTFVTEGPEDSGLVDVRDAASGVSLRSWHGHDVDVNDVAYDHDGTRLATTGDDGAARIWDPTTGRERHVLRGPPETQVYGPSFSPDGTRFAAGWADGEAGSVRVLDLDTGDEAEHELPGPATRTAFSPDGATLAIGIDAIPGPVLLLDTTDGRLVRSLDGHTYPVSDLRWSVDGRWIATASTDGTARIWDVGTGTTRHTLHDHRSPVVAVDWATDGSRLATGSLDGTAMVWEVTEGGVRRLLTLAAHDTRSGVWGVAFSPDGARLLTGAAVEEVAQIWDVTATGGGQWGTFPAPSDPAGVAFTADDRLITVDEEALRMWDLGSGTEVGQMALTAAVTDLDVSPDGELIAAVGSTSATVWDAASGSEVFVISAPGVASHRKVAWSPDGTWLAVAGAERGRVSIVDRAGQEVAAYEGPEFEMHDVAVSPDGSLLALATWFAGRIDLEASTVKLWDRQHGEVVRELAMPAEGVAFAPDGDRVATVGWGGLGKIWDLTTGDVVTLAGHTGTIFDVAFAPDGSRLATAGFDGTVRLWDPDVGRALLVLDAHEGPVFQVRFNADGTKLATSSPDGTVRVWALDLDDLVTLAQERLTRNFTREECRQYLHVDQCPDAGA